MASIIQTARKATTATSSGRLLLIHAWTPHAEEGGEVVWHERPAGLNSSVSWYGRPVSADQSKYVEAQLKVNGKLPDFLSMDKSGGVDLTLRHNEARFPNLKLAFPCREESASGLGFGVYCVEGNNLTRIDISLFPTDDVKDMLDLAQHAGASNICILTQCPARSKIAELVGSCEGCGEGHGFLHLNEGTTDFLLASQCHACGGTLSPEALLLAGCTWDMQLQIMNRDHGRLKDHGVTRRRATDNMQLPDRIPIASSPRTSIRKLRITLYPNFETVPIERKRVASSKTACTISRRKGNLSRGLATKDSKDEH